MQQADVSFAAECMQLTLDLQLWVGWKWPLECPLISTGPQFCDEGTHSGTHQITRVHWDQRNDEPRKKTTAAEGKVVGAHRKRRKPMQAVVCR